MEARELRIFIALLSCCVLCCYGQLSGPSALDGAREETFSIHVISANEGDNELLDLLPLAGSYEYLEYKKARENEEKKYFDTSAVSEEAQMAYTIAAGLLDSKNRNSDKKRIYGYLESAAWMGHVEAQEMVATQYLFGDYLPLNISGARELFEILSRKGHPSGQLGLAVLHGSGLGMNQSSQPLALLHFMFAGLGGNSYAQMALGYRYLNGINVENNCEQALHFYRKVALKVADHVPVTGGTSMQKIRLFEEFENPGLNTNLDDDLKQYYEFIAEKGDTSAQQVLGQLYLQGGRGLPQDRTLAYRYFKKAADGGSAVAHAYLGRMYLEGSAEVPQNNETAFTYFKQAADMGNHVGQSGLGLIYLYGRGVPADYKLAMRYFKLAAEQNSVEGQAQQGIMLFHGLGIERDIVKAVKLLNQASQGGSVLALFHLAEINAFGLGVSRVCKTAAELYKNVAERGKWNSLFMEAFMDYKRGRTNSAVIKYMLLAEMGYEVAQSNVAFLLDTGDSTVFTKNETQRRAIVYLERSAAQGYHVARLKLGDYFYYGIGTDVDYELAVNNYILAQDGNNPQALFNVGYMYQRGLGVKQDLFLAKRAYDKAVMLTTDAHAPVALALISLGVLFAWQQFVGTFRNLSTPHASYMDILAESVISSWDLYLGAGLFVILIVVVVTMQRMKTELNRQRQRRRNSAREAAAAQNPLPPQEAPNVPQHP